MNVTKISRKLSLVLRHQPESIGLTLDEHGWADVDELINRLFAYKIKVDKVGLEELVRTNDKQRFRFSEDGLKIRANQGHSIDVDLQMKKLTPPHILFHGTASRFLVGIKEKGLVKRSRQHVHLSSNQETAIKVGSRHGCVVILNIAALQMYNDGYDFYQSDNGVWLTDHVPMKYIATQTKK